MRTIAWVAVSLLACACGSKDDERGPAPPTKPAADARVAVAKPVDAAPAPPPVDVDVDAAPVNLGAVVDLAALPELGAPGPDGAVQVHLADAPVSVVRNALADLGKVSVIEPHDATRITGRIGPTTGAHAWGVAAGGALGATARVVKRGGKGLDVDLDFTEADPANLYRLIAMIERENIVLGVSKAPTIDLRVKRLPADQVAAVITERLGLTRERHGAVTWIHDASFPALDKALVARKGPGKVSLDVKDARPGEIYALLAKLGAITDGAACDAGAAATFRLQDVPLGAAVAVTAALSGQAPAPNVACAGGIGDGDLRDLVLVGIARLGTRRVAGFRAARGGAFTVIERGASLAGATVKEIGDGFVSFERVATDAGPPDQIAMQLFPSQLTTDDPDAPVSPVTLGGRSRLTQHAFESGRLAATFIGGAELRDRRALFELPDGRWYVLDGSELMRGDASTRIEPGKVVYEDEGLTAREIVLRTSR